MRKSEKIDKNKSDAISEISKKNKYSNSLIEKAALEVEKRKRESVNNQTHSESKLEKI